MLSVKETILYVFRWIGLRAAAVAAIICSLFKSHNSAITGPIYDKDIDCYVPLESVIKENYSLNKRLKIKLSKKQGYIETKFAFCYQPYDEDKLKTVRSKYRLDEVVSAAKNEFDELILLRNWVRLRYKRAEYQPLRKYFDGLALLDNLKFTIHELNPKLVYSACHSYSFLYAQILLSMGLQARIVSISNDRKAFHCLTEVWSNDFKKWMVMDTFFNLYYEKDGIPLNCLELHNSLSEGLTGIRYICDSDISDDVEKGIPLDKLVSFFKYFRVELRNDWMTNRYFRGHPRASDMVSVWWQRNTLPIKYTLSPSASNSDDLYWSLNQIDILALPTQDLPLKLLFKTQTPNFKCFEIVLDNKKRLEHKEGFFSWDLHKGENKLLVAALNDHNRRGIPNEIVLQLE